MDGETKYSSSELSESLDRNPPEKRRSFLQRPKSYISKLPAPSTTYSTPLQPAPVEAETPKTQPIPIPQNVPGQNTAPDPIEHQEFFIGDRVSIGGVKTGTLLYYGSTHLASGLWCGIALDDPEGIHDGLVNDVRYFTCRKGHGIFAPVERVTHLDHKAIQAIVKSKPKVSQLPSKSKLYDISSIRDEIGHQDRSNELLDQCDNDLDDNILGLDENGIIRDDDDDEEINSRENNKPKRKLPKLPCPVSHAYSNIQHIRKDIISLDENILDESLETIQTVSSDGEDTDDIDEKIDVHELHHSGGGSSGGEDSWSLNNDYIAMCDGKAQYLNITFDGESESKTSTQEPSEESPSPEFIFDQEMIEDGEFAAQPMEMNQDASLGLISSFALDKNDLLSELFGNDDEDDVDAAASQDTIEPMSEDKDITPENQVDLNISAEFDEADIAASSCLENESDFRSKINLNSTYTQDDAESSKVQDNVCLNSTYTQAELQMNKVLNSTFTQENTHISSSQSNADILESLNGTYALDDEAKASEMSVKTSAISNKAEILSSAPMTDSGISMRGSMTDSAMSGNSVRTSMVESGISLKGSMIDPSIRRSMLDSGISVHCAMLDSNIVLQKGEASVSGEVDKCNNKYSIDSDVTVKSEKVGIGKEIIHKDMDDGKLIRDLSDGHQRKERPISFMSTTSADTGYVPDTDSELGTLTLNSPQEWMDKGFHGNIPDHTHIIQKNNIQDYQGTCLSNVDRLPVESDSDIGTMTGDTDNEADRIEWLKSEGVTMNNIEENADESEDEITEVDDTETLDRTMTIEKEGDSTQESSEDKNSGLDSILDIPESNSGVPSESKDDSSESIPMVNISIEDKGNTKTNEQAKNDKKKTEKQKPVKKKKFNVVKDFKKPNTTNVVSKLSEYLKTPVPVKPREDKSNTEEFKNKRNSLKGKIDLSKVTSKIANKSVNEETKKVNGENEKKDSENVVEKEPPKKIKRTPPKSKWDTIMSQIDNKKDQEKVKSKPEVKSKVEAFLHIPPPAPPKKEEPPKPKRRISSAIPDYSRVQSKLKYTAPVPPAKPKKDESPNRSKVETPNRKNTESPNRSSTESPRMKLDSPKHSSPSSSKTKSPSRKNKDVSPSQEKEKMDRGRKSSNGLLVNDRVRDLSGDSIKRPEIKDKALHIDLADSLDGRGSVTGTGSVLSSRQNSQTDISTTEDDAPTFKQLPQIQQTMLLQDRRDSSTSVSEISEIGSQATAEEIEMKQQKVLANQQRRRSALQPPSNSADDQNRNKTSKSKKESKEKNKPAETVLAEVHTKEVQRLEALCESRTKQLSMVTLQIQSSNVAFDGMSSVVNYLANDLDGFSSPRLYKETESLKKEIGNDKRHITTLEEQKLKLEEIIAQLKEQHKDYVNSLETENDESLIYQRERLTSEHQEMLALLKERKSTEMSELRNAHETSVARRQHEHAVAAEKMRTEYSEGIHDLQRRQENQMEELHKQHQDKLENITGRFDSIKLTLSDKVETLRSECDRLQDRARSCEEALQRDSDFKVQCALAPYKSLPQEIESLKTVVEMRNEEISKLRNHNVDLQKRLEELPIAQEKIIALQQKKENLEAIISMKTDHEKVLHERCQSLMRKYDKESRANKRLSMEYEELMWKLSESFSETDLGSQEALFYQKLGMSPTGSGDFMGSPGQGRKLRTPSGSDDSPSRSPGYRRTLSSNMDDREEKKLKRRSGNYLLDDKKNRPSSPLAKQNPLTKSWSPSTQSESPTRVNKGRSGNNMSQSWCVDMDASDDQTENVSKIPRSQSNSERVARRKVIKTSAENGDLSELEKDFVSLDDSITSQGLSESELSDSIKANSISKGEDVPLSSTPKSGRERVILSDETNDVFNDVSTSKPVSERVLSNINESVTIQVPTNTKNESNTSGQSVSLLTGIMSCPVSKLPTKVEEHTSNDTKSAAMTSHTETTV